MQGRTRLTRALWRAAAAVLVGLFAFCIAIPAADAGAPSPTPSNPSKSRALPVSLHLGGLNISVTVPLTLNGLLGKSPTPTPTATPSTPPVTSPTMTSSQPASQSTHHVGADATSTAGPYPPRAPGGGGPPTYATTAAHHPSVSAPTTTKRATKHRTDTGLILVKGLVPSSGSLLLIALCAACALGVVFVLKLSGRGTHKG